MSRDANTFISSLSQAVRDNPFAAALIGGGAVWLMFGSRPIGSALGGVASVTQPVAESGKRSAARAVDTVTGAADAMASAGSRAADAITESTGSAARAAGDAAMSGTSVVKEHVSETFSQAADNMNHVVGRAAETLRSVPNPLPQLQKGYVSAESTLTNLFERQPLVLGTIGFAIGAGVASAFASTALENEWAGPLSDDVKDAVKERAEHVAEATHRAAGEAGSEFRAAAGDAAEKLRKAGEDAVQTVRETADADAGRD